MRASNVFTIPKNKVYLDKFKEKIVDKEDVIIVGAGFIGVEIPDEINKTGKNVTLIEVLARILGLAFDEEICRAVEEELKARGVHILTGVGLQEILGEERVNSIQLSNGEIIKTDTVILSMGYRPNVELALKAGIKVNEKGFIAVDEYMRTSEKDIFAVGDCAGNTSRWLN